MNSNDNNRHLVIIGGTAAGLSAASKARRIDPNIPITVYERTSYVSYGSCGLPYFIGDIIKDHNDLITYNPEYLHEKRNITVKIHHEVTALDLKNNSVSVRDLNNQSEFKHHFSQLIIATGATPSRPPFKGIDLDNIFTLRTVEDALKIKQLIKNNSVKKVAIIGGGYIGLEMAEAFRNCNIDVSVFEMMSQVLPLFDTEYAAIVEKEIRKHGVKVYTSCKVAEFIGENGKVKSIVTSDGAIYDTDLVLISAGVKPNSQLARTAGLEIGLAGAIVVDEFMQTSYPNVWACGDCVQMQDVITKKPVYYPLGPTANKQGRIAGGNALGEKTAFLGVLGTQATKIFDIYTSGTGMSEGKAKEFGFDIVISKTVKTDKASYYPGSMDTYIKLILEKNTGRILGANILGSETSAQRINVFVAAITAGYTVQQLNQLDLVYAPPVAPVYDPILIAASQGLKLI